MGGDDEIPETYPSCYVCFQFFISNQLQDRPKEVMQFMISFTFSSLLHFLYRGCLFFFFGEARGFHVQESKAGVRQAHRIRRAIAPLCRFRRLPRQRNLFLRPGLLPHRLRSRPGTTLSHPLPLPRNIFHKSIFL